MLKVTKSQRQFSDSIFRSPKLSINQVWTIAQKAKVEFKSVRFLKSLLIRLSVEFLDTISLP